MAELYSIQQTITNGRTPVSAADIECFARIAFENAEGLEAMFRTIARLTDDAEIKALCGYGAFQAFAQVAQIDAIMERTLESGLVARAPLITCIRLAKFRSLAPDMGNPTSGIFIWAFAMAILGHLIGEELCDALGLTNMHYD